MSHKKNPKDRFHVALEKHPKDRSFEIFIVFVLLKIQQMIARVYFIYGMQVHI